MATHGERLTALETKVKVLEENKSELWDQFNKHKEDVPKMIESEVKEAKADMEKHTNTKLAGQTNAIVVKIFLGIGSLLIIQTIVEKIAG